MDFKEIKKSKKNLDFLYDLIYLLILKYNLGLSYSDISKLLNINESSAKTLCYRARNAFKNIWESEKYE